ncbi:MAG: hypothetical protein F4103_12295 [Boseongicola sp. SB0673_bin_14]|nr:hypothetical protein [Boseongicola sp. SB0667_bin_21]MYI69478.1 hypothetical protein [Boseongicola sp. SB0673_bin_14]
MGDEDAVEALSGSRDVESGAVEALRDFGRRIAPACRWDWTEDAHLKTKPDAASERGWGLSTSARVPGGASGIFHPLFRSVTPLIVLSDEPPLTLSARLLKIRQ